MCPTLGCSIKCRIGRDLRNHPSIPQRHPSEEPGVSRKDRPVQSPFIEFTVGLGASGPPTVETDPECPSQLVWNKGNSSSSRDRAEASGLEGPEDTGLYQVAGDSRCVGMGPAEEVHRQCQVPVRGKPEGTGDEAESYFGVSSGGSASLYLVGKLSSVVIFLFFHVFSSHGGSLFLLFCFVCLSSRLVLCSGLGIRRLVLVDWRPQDLGSSLCNVLGRCW